METTIVISVTSGFDLSNNEVTLISVTMYSTDLLLRLAFTYISLVIQEYCNIKLIGTPRNWP